MGSMLRYKRMTGEEVGEIASGDIVSVITLLYCCVCSACSSDGIDFGMTLEEFADELTPEEFAEATKSLFPATEQKKRK